MIGGFTGVGTGGAGFTGARTGRATREAIMYTSGSYASPLLVWVGGEEKGIFSKNLTSAKTKYLPRLGQ